MVCNNCKVLNEDNTTVCKSCGGVLSIKNISSNAEVAQSLNYLLILISWDYFIGIAWYYIQKVYIPQIYYNGSQSSFSEYDLYKVIGWSMDLISILLLFIFFLLSKVKTVRAFLIVFLIIKVALIIGYRLIN